MSGERMVQGRGCGDEVGLRRCGEQTDGSHQLKETHALSSPDMALRGSASTQGTTKRPSWEVSCSVQPRAACHTHSSISSSWRME